MPYMSVSYFNVTGTGTLNTNGVNLYIDIFVAIIIIVSFYLFFKLVLTDLIKDPNIDHTIDEEWRSTKDKERHEEDVNEFLEYVTEDIEDEDTDIK